MRKIYLILTIYVMLFCIHDTNYDAINMQINTPNSQTLISHHHHEEEFVFEYNINFILSENYFFFIVSFPRTVQLYPQIWKPPVIS